MESMVAQAAPKPEAKPVPAAGGAGVLALDPHRLGALLQIAGLIHHQHRPRVAQVLDQPGAEVVTHPVVVPRRAGRQMLHPIRRGVPGVLGQRPAILAGQIRQQPLDKRPGPPAWLHPWTPARDPAQQLLQPGLPAGKVSV